MEYSCNHSCLSPGRVISYFVAVSDTLVFGDSATRVATTATRFGMAVIAHQAANVLERWNKSVEESTQTGYAAESCFQSVDDVFHFYSVYISLARTFRISVRI
jgi:hypothetical protein